MVPFTSSSLLINRYSVMSAVGDFYSHAEAMTKYSSNNIIKTTTTTLTTTGPKHMGGSGQD